MKSNSKRYKSGNSFKDRSIPGVREDKSSSTWHAVIYGQFFAPLETLEKIKSSETQVPPKGGGAWILQRSLFARHYAKVGKLTRVGLLAANSEQDCLFAKLPLACPIVLSARGFLNDGVQTAPQKVE
jgi:hypothetical protein